MKMVKVKLVLQTIKSLEKTIKSISHTLSSDELQDIMYYIETLKSQLK
jgi:hypothetical protein